MNEQQPNQQPDYGVRLTGDALAAHQQQQQAQNPPAEGGEYGPQGQQASGSEYGPQGGGAPQYPAGAGYQQPGFQQPSFQQPGYQQPGFQQPVQPQFGGPQLHPDMAREPVRPKSIDLSFWSIVTAGVFYLISHILIALLPNRGMSDAEIALVEDMLGSMMADPALPFDSVESYLSSPMMTTVLIGQAVITLVVYVLVAAAIRNGWRSMRIVGTIFAALSLFNFSFASPLVALFSVLAVVLGIVGIVYSWLPSSTEYFRQKAWQKAARRVYPDAPSR